MRSTRFFLWVALALAGFAAIAFLYVWAALNWSYSTGERAGYVQKFSRKGWICKTWEGELAMVTMPGAVAEKFAFSVRDAAVAKQINASMGRRVAIDYEQHLGVPGSCFAETEYYVVGLRQVEELPQITGQGAQPAAAPAPAPAPAASAAATPAPATPAPAAPR